MAGPVFWEADDTTEVLRFYRDFAADAPDGLGTVVTLGTIPPLTAIPAYLHWRQAVATIFLGNVIVLVSTDASGHPISFHRGVTAVPPRA